ncbi:MAG: hypothetical protein RI910_2082 [Verrucomicrobiota bacterium]|jgi:hypothetical protein
MRPLPTIIFWTAGLACLADLARAATLPGIEQTCFECHDKETAKGDVDLSALPFNLKDHHNRERWAHIYDVVAKGEMPPKKKALSATDRQKLADEIAGPLLAADAADVKANGRGPRRRLNRDEYEQNLRDLLGLPDLDIRDILPADREGHHFNKTSATLDMSRVQLTAYLDAAETALRQAMSAGATAPKPKSYRFVGTALFPSNDTFGNKEAMFFARNGRSLNAAELKAKDVAQDATIELALFRSPHWPYYGYPKGFIAAQPGYYRVRFSARSVLQQKGYLLTPAIDPVPMTFRARKPSGPDVSGDVRATGGLMDIQPMVATYETTIRLLPNETFEYSLLGLPVPLARNVQGGPPTYRYPPLPAGGQPGVAFQWMEVEGPLLTSAPATAYRVLFPEHIPATDSKALLRHFVRQAAREPVDEETLRHYDGLIQARLERKEPLNDALLAAYKAFLCSGHFLYLREPTHDSDHFAVADRLSHFLANSRPDARLRGLATDGKLSDAALRTETDRLLADAGFDRFVRAFTDYWLNLRHVRRDEPDIRLYPEYRFDDYLVESMGEETRTYFTGLIRDNLPARNLVQADFIYANDRLSRHYGLPPLQGSAMRKVTLPAGSPLGGLLTQAAILKVTSNGTTTSPVVRGAWVMERIIGEPPPPPPAKVPAVEPDIRGAKTIRDLLARHTQDQSCANCHARFDPAGFALENFDILGGWRQRYRGLELGDKVAGIDRAGHDFSYTLADVVDASGKLRDGRKFADVRELKAHFAAQPRQLARNLLHQFVLYATGTPVRFADRPKIEAILDACAQDEYRVRDLLHGFIQSPLFRGPPR